MENSNKKLIIIIVAIFLTPILVVFVCYFYYFISLFNESKKLQKQSIEKFTEATIKGTVLGKSEAGNSCSLQILGEGQSFNCIFPCNDNTNLMLFVTEGDSILKNSKTNTVSVLKSVSNEKRNFNICFKF